MALVKFYYGIILFFLFSSAAIIPAFEAGAYIPAYRLKFIPGAENSLGRPVYDPSPQAWIGQLQTSPAAKLSDHWYDEDWSLKLARGYDSFYLHIPLDNDFLTGISPDFRHISFLNSLIKAEPSRVYLSLIGNSAEFMPIVSSEEGLKDLSEQLNLICQEYNLSGIDIDWEFPSSPRANEKEGITKLAGKLKEILPESVILSITLSRWRLPDQELFNIADEIHLMAYDGYGKHSTSESAIADSEIVLTRYNLSPEKLILGLPFYGRNYNPESEGYWKDTKNYGEIIREYSPGPDEDTTNDFFFNGRTTIIKKTNWALTRGLGGVFVWEPFYDADGYESLTDAILQTMIRN